MADDFIILGYFREYMSGGKLVATERLEAPDRELTGYEGRQIKIAEETIKFPNGKRIKKGAEYYTMIYPLCGRLKK